MIQGIFDDDEEVERDQDKAGKTESDDEDLLVDISTKQKRKDPGLSPAQPSTRRTRARR